MQMSEVAMSALRAIKDLTLVNVGVALFIVSIIMTVRIWKDKD